MTLAPGQPLPAFRTEAAVSGRALDNAALAGRKALLVLHGPRTAEAAKQAAKAVRERWGSGEVALASVVDLRSFSGLFRRIAEAQLKATYGKLAEKATAAGLDPAEEVLICPDWDGSVCALLGAARPDEEAVLLCVGADGRVLASAKDAAQALAALQGVRPFGPDAVPHE